MYAHGKNTDRLLIRKLSLEDAPVWTEFFINNPSLPFLGIEMDKTPEDNAREWIEWQLKRYDEARYGHHALINKETGEFIGQCGLLTQKVEEKIEIEVGYHILPKYWGRGYATEAARFFRDFGFENENLDQIISVIDIRNTASQNVATKNGMEKGRQIKYFNLDVFIYGITRDEWQLLNNAYYNKRLI